MFAILMAASFTQFPELDLLEPPRPVAVTILPSTKGSTRVTLRLDAKNEPTEVLVAAVALWGMSTTPLGVESLPGDSTTEVRLHVVQKVTHEDLRGFHAALKAILPQACMNSLREFQKNLPVEMVTMRNVICFFRNPYGSVSDETFKNELTGWMRDHPGLKAQFVPIKEGGKLRNVIIIGPDLFDARVEHELRARRNGVSPPPAPGSIPPVPGVNLPTPSRDNWAALRGRLFPFAKGKAGSFLASA